jgi:hypothetical protein
LYIIQLQGNNWVVLEDFGYLWENDKSPYNVHNLKMDKKATDLMYEKRTDKDTLHMCIF